MGDHYVFQAGFKALSESRTSGQAHHTDMQTGDLYKVNAERKSKVDDNTAKMQSIKWLGV